MTTEGRSDSISMMTTDPTPSATSVVVCSLEPWSEVRRRIRIMVDELVDLDPGLQVLYVTPAIDYLDRLRHLHRVRAGGPRLEQVAPRINVLRPRKWLPRALGPFADRSLERQVLQAVRELALPDPLLWVNDASYAQLAVRSGWPVLYDVTDDWLLAALSARQRDRLIADERLLLEYSDEVVVCSPALERSRGHHREVALIPNGVDIDLFGRSHPRPRDLPPSPVVLYAGTLHGDRLDLPLVRELAGARPDVAVVLLGPTCLAPRSSAELEALPNVHLLGARPYAEVPAYQQHADVVIVPHRVTPFTESLDPIKAYEALAVGRPTVATPVAGFRHLGAPVVVAERGRFVEATLSALASAPPPGTGARGDRFAVPSWHERAAAMATTMERARERGDL